MHVDTAASRLKSENNMAKSTSTSIVHFGGLTIQICHNIIPKIGMLTSIPTPATLAKH